MGYHKGLEDDGEIIFEFFRIEWRVIDVLTFVREGDKCWHVLERSDLDGTRQIIASSPH